MGKDARTFQERTNMPVPGSSMIDWIVWALSLTTAKIAIIAIVLTGALMPAGIWVNTKIQDINKATAMLHNINKEDIVHLSVTLKDLNSNINKLKALDINITEIKKSSDLNAKEIHALRREIDILIRLISNKKSGIMVKSRSLIHSPK